MFNIISKKICYVQRKSDGKLLNADKTWSWVDHTEEATMLSESIIVEQLERNALEVIGITKINQLKFVNNIDEVRCLASQSFKIYG